MSPASRLILASALCLAAPALAQLAVSEIVQKGRAFTVAEIHIAPGGVVRFSNQDEFGHQIYVDAPGMHVDTDESEPGEHMDVPFPAAGTFPVRCHIHPRMHLNVIVQ